LASLPLLLGLLLAVNLVQLLALLMYQRSDSSQAAALKGLRQRSDELQQALTQQFSSATADLASRLEQTKGDLRQEVSDRLNGGFATEGAAATVGNRPAAEVHHVGIAALRLDQIRMPGALQFNTAITV